MFKLNEKWKEEKVNSKVEVIPEDWTSFKFNKFIENCSEGGTPPTNNFSYYNNGNIKWVTIKDIKKHIYDTEVKITDLGLKNSSAKMWDINDIILSTGATIGEVGIAKTKLCTKQGITGIKVNKNNNYKYIYYLLKHNTFILKKHSSGSTFLALTKKNLKLIDFILPELNEQILIRDFLENNLENIDNLIIKVNNFN